MTLMLLMMMLPPLMMLPPPTLSYIPNLKRKIDPISMIKQTNKQTVTDVGAADDNAYHNTMDTSPHAPNSATAPDAEIRLLG